MSDTFVRTVGFPFPLPPFTAGRFTEADNVVQQTEDLLATLVKTRAFSQPKTLSETAAKRRREEERQAVLKAVGALNLQSVIHSGTRKSCMINNTLYTEGQQVDSFVVERISPDAVVVRNGVYRFELRMQK